jgi:T-complex protein 1 subunit zeta
LLIEPPIRLNYLQFNQLTGELLKQAERYTSEGLHPRLITEGYEIAKEMALEFLDAFKVNQPKIFHDRELLTNVVRTSLRTKLAAESADKMSDAIVDAMLAISEEGQPIDLHMVEVMQVRMSHCRFQQLVYDRLMTPSSKSIAA